MMHTDDVFFLY